MEVPSSACERDPFLESWEGKRASGSNRSNEILVHGSTQVQTIVQGSLCSPELVCLLPRHVKLSQLHLHL